jgi:oligopeptide transport system ATP-binding protein
MTPLLSVNELFVSFPVRGGVFSTVKKQVQAVRGVSFFIHPGETLALVGESGCGKTTVARAALRLAEASAGEVIFAGTDLASLSRSELRAQRRAMQLVFQDPDSALNPRLPVRRLIGDGLLAHGLATKGNLGTRVGEILSTVGLDGSFMERYSFQLSGGQKQRVGIARALALAPQLLVCDEAVSALDVSVQAQILNLLSRLRDEFGLAYLFVSHDLNVVRHIADRVAVMYLGQIVETGPVDAVLSSPSHPYSQALVASNPIPDPTRPLTAAVLEGEVPSPENPPPGCAFRSRCVHAIDVCGHIEPPRVKVAAAHHVSCHLHVEAPTTHESATYT